MIQPSQELDIMNDEAKETTEAPSQPANRPRILISTDLLQGFKEVLIAHGEETYRLRLTRNGKLILHK